MKIALVGLGALGSFLADALRGTPGLKQLYLIDHDRVEHKNVAGQLYGQRDIGKKKAEVTRQRLQLLGVPFAVGTRPRKLTISNAGFILGGLKPDLVIDCTDNTAARLAVLAGTAIADAPSLHVAIDARGVHGTVIWGEHLGVLDRAEEGTPTCEDIENRPHHMLVAAVAAKCVLFYARDERRRSAIIRGASVTIE